jgi:hypothetical protein
MPLTLGSVKAGAAVAKVALVVAALALAPTELRAKTW